MRRLTHEARRQQLLELGLGLFGARGYADVVIDDIAAEAGISKGLLYHYFGSKRQFYAACVEITARRLVDRILAVDRSDPVGAVRDGLARWIDVIEAHAAAYRSLVTGALGAEPEVQVALEAARSAIARFALEGIGVDPERPAFRVAIRAWIGGVEVATLGWLERHDLDRDALVELHTRSLAGAVAAALAIDDGVTLRPEVQAAVERFSGVRSART